MILSKFDPNPRAVYNPEDATPRIPGIPAVGISCFSAALFARILEMVSHREIGEMHSASASAPVYELDFHGVKLAAFNAQVGAPACVSMYEEMLAAGLEKLVLFGTCGVLDRSIKDCSVIIPTTAVRDEGVSYHYAPPSDEIACNLFGIDDFTAILDSHNCRYTLGKTWTTDAKYRETPDKVAQRKAAGCLCVEMECVSMAAVSQFRKKELFHFLYAADNLDGTRWDKRSLNNYANLDAKAKIALLALEMAAHMAAE